MGIRLKIRQLIGAAVLSVLGSALIAQELPACSDEVAHLRGEFGSLKFNIELADTAIKRSKGLMHRESLARTAGMLFVYQYPRRAGFWMRNTLIPLDMLFFDETGRLLRIHHEAQPLDETHIDGGPGVLAVLEINGGLARRYGIEPGAEIRHPVFSSNSPAWPC